MLRVQPTSIISATARAPWCVRPQLEKLTEMMLVCPLMARHNSSQPLSPIGLRHSDTCCSDLQLLTPCIHTTSHKWAGTVLFIKETNQYFYYNFLSDWLPYYKQTCLQNWHTTHPTALLYINNTCNAHFPSAPSISTI